MFQSYAFQSYAFQTVAATNDNNTGGKKEGYTYIKPYDEYLQRQEKLRKEKSELQKLDSVVAEYRRKAAMAAQNKVIAEATAAVRLAKLENEYLEEINRLMQVRALLLLRIKQNEEALVILLMLMRRRLRA